MYREFRLSGCSLRRRGSVRGGGREIRSNRRRRRGRKKEKLNKKKGRRRRGSLCLNDAKVTGKHFSIYAYDGHLISVIRVI